MGKNSLIEWTTKSKSKVSHGTGYILVYCPDYPAAKPNGFVFEHRLVMANILGRPLSRNEVVHHINGERSDNRPENLELMTNSEHSKRRMSKLSVEEKRKMAYGLVKYAKEHKQQRRLVECACGCGRMIETPDKKCRDHRFVRGHNTKGRTWKWHTKQR